MEEVIGKKKRIIKGIKNAGKYGKLFGKILIGGTVLYFAVNGAIHTYYDYKQISPEARIFKAINVQGKDGLNNQAILEQLKIIDGVQEHTVIDRTTNGSKVKEESTKSTYKPIFH